MPDYSDFRGKNKGLADQDFPEATSRDFRYTVARTVTSC
jgi:hypothetical protein